jgi:hypothetical protein
MQYLGEDDARLGLQSIHLSTPTLKVQPRSLLVAVDKDSDAGSSLIYARRGSLE